MTKTTLDELKRCRICGFTGPLVTPGIYRLKSGKFVTIARCQDHQACDSRRLARSMGIDNPVTQA